MQSRSKVSSQLLLFVLAIALLGAGCQKDSTVGQRKALGTANGDFYVGDDGMSLAEAEAAQDEYLPRMKVAFQELASGKFTILMLLPSGECGAILPGCLLYNSLDDQIRKPTNDLFGKYSGDIVRELNDPKALKIELTSTPVTNRQGKSVLAGNKKLADGSYLISIYYPTLPHAEAYVEEVTHELLHVVTGRDDTSATTEREFKAAGRFLVKYLDRRAADAAMEKNSPSLPGVSSVAPTAGSSKSNVPSVPSFPPPARPKR